MRLTAFASRNTKEILRDPLTFCFGLGFPVVLLLLLSAINSAIPEQAQMTMFNIDKLTPGITVFGMSFISLGLLLGTLLNEKAVGGICGALLTNLSAWFSNIWFDTEMVGGWFKNLANALPFANAVNAARDAISGNYSDIMPELIPVCGYAVVLLVLAVVVFSVMMKRNK